MASSDYHIWHYRARPTRVVDGDTIDMLVDLGFNVHTRQRIRLMGVDTHEIYGVSHDSEEYQRGMTEKQFVEDWLPEADDGEWPVFVKTYEGETGKYGRYLGEIIRRDGRRLTQDLKQEFDDI